MQPLPNQVFHGFLSVFSPELATSFRKIGGTYQTYSPSRKNNHRYIYDVARDTITHLFYKVKFTGLGYERGDLVSEEFVVSCDGKSIKIDRKG